MESTVVDMASTVLIAKDPVQISKQRYYRPELDALRFFAFLCVFYLHTDGYFKIDPTQHLWFSRLRIIGVYGVPVFFLLSAYLITDLLFRERERTGRIHIPSFYMRRILRIWPLYFSMFIGLALLNRFIPGVGTDDPKAWLAFTFLCGNWYVIHHGWIASPIDPLWSISIEEQFYLIIPILAARGGRRAVIFASSILLACSYLTVSYYAIHPAGLNAWLNSLVQFQFFCTGTLIALALRGGTLRLAVPLRAAGFVSGIVCWLAAVTIGTPVNYNVAARFIASWLLVLTGTILVFLCTLGTPSRLVPSWLAYFGKISYGLYIFHSLVFVLLFKIIGNFSVPLLLRNHLLASIIRGLEIALALGIDLLLAHLSFVYFEGYFLGLKRRFTFVASRD
jgi:peptidoglycan/LPS O-acetylase OafA/YrhL